MKLGERFERAVDLALELHNDEPRKGSGVNYMGHLLGVAAIVIDDGGNEDEVLAALLHDGPEDRGGEETLDRIRRDFGEQVGAMVEALSDTFEAEKPPWKERKEKYLDKLREMPEGSRTRSVLRVSLADKLYNARAIAFDFGGVGENVWDRFRAPKEDQLWYYGSLGPIYADKLGADNPLVKAYLDAEANLRSLGG